MKKKLVAAGHEVTVISNGANKQPEIEASGPKAAIGSVTDAAFISAAFKDADAVCLMLPNVYGVPVF